MQGTRVAILAALIAAVVPATADAAQDLTISNAETMNIDVGPGTFTTSAEDAILNVGDLTDALATGDVVVSTGASDTQPGNLTIAEPLSWSEPNSLDLTALGAMNINAPITTTADGAEVTVEAGTGIVEAPGVSVAIAGATVASTDMGVVDLDAGPANDFGDSLQIVDAPDGIAVNDVDNLALRGAVSSGGGLSVKTGGRLSQQGPIDIAGPTAVDTGGAEVSLGQQSNTFANPVSVAPASDVSLGAGEDLTVAAVTAAADLDITVGDNAIVVAGPAVATGDTFLAGNAVIAESPGNDFQDSVDIFSSGPVRVRDANDLSLAQAHGTDAVFTAGLNLRVGSSPLEFSSVTLVSDAAAGSTPGPGGVTIAPGARLESPAAPLRIYTADRAQNAIASSANLNGGTFTPGAEFVNTPTEVWGTAFPGGTASQPFTVFYKEAGQPPTPPTPETELMKTPKKKIKTKRKRVRVSFAFASTVPGSTFTCTLDGRERPCTSPFKAKVKKGRHVFRVAATAAGKTDQTPAKFRFKVKRKRR